eukprot:SAG11_NODE_411_length_9696_cov_46.841513_9_plen_115_part_00
MNPAKRRELEDRPKMVRVTHACAANPYRPGDLELDVGDIVVVIDADVSKPWWRGYRQSEPERIGEFPVAFVEDFDDMAGAEMELEILHSERREHTMRHAKVSASTPMQKYLHLS